MIRVLVFGTGSIGSVYSCILSRAGAAVTCVCRSNYDVVKSDGLRVTSTVFGELHERPIVVANIAEAMTLSKAPFDYVLVCTKATPLSTSAAIESIKPAIMPQFTSIVLIQNGLGVERAFQEAFPETPIISGVAYLPTTQTSSGIFSHSEVEMLYLGLYHPGRTTSTWTNELNNFAQQVKAGGGTVVVSQDIQAQRWTKVVANGAVNPICALSRCRDRQLIELSRVAANLVKDVMLEIATVAAAAGYGHVATIEMVEKQFARSVTRPYPGVQPSMMADALSAQPMEVQAILGEIVRVAQEKQVEIPRLTTLFVLLQGLDVALQTERDRSSVAKV